MPKICYVPKKFKPETVDMIDQANEIIEDYQAQGYDLTLRQLYYQFVARDMFPDDRRWRWTGSRWVRDLNGTKNADPNYKWLGSIINDGRLAGLIDWECITDRTRNLRRNSHWESPEEIIYTAAKGYRKDLWENQAYRPEVYIEKDALVGVIEGVCEELDVPYFSCRGYTSQSEMWAAARRIEGYFNDGYEPVIFHLGDHDPSGIDMTRDITDRMELFMGGVDVQRLALNMDQVQQYDPPPNPAKITDSRAVKYIDLYGNESWELDALDPTTLSNLVRNAILGIRDEGKYQESVDEQENERGLLNQAALNWDSVAERLQEGM